MKGTHNLVPSTQKEKGLIFMLNYTESAIGLTLPCVPLRGIVAFPGIPLNFELTNEMCRRAVDAASRTAERLVFLTLQKNIADEKPSPDDLFEIGVIAKIKQTIKTPDGTQRVLFEGQCRAVCEGFRRGHYITADISLKSTDNDSVPDANTAALMRELQTVMEKTVRYLPNISKEIVFAVNSIKSIGLLCDFIALNILHSISDKQTVLSEFDPEKRAQTLLVLLNNELELLALELKIRSKVKEQMDKNQRDYYLREQMKAIEEELGEDEDEEIRDYTEKIEKLKFDEDTHEKLMKDIKKLSKSPFSSAESSVLRNYLDTVLDVPWNKFTPEKNDIAHAKKILDRDHYGLDKVKERILEYIAVKSVNPELRHQIICLVGPPGVGKTSIASSLAEAMKRKFVRTSLGGVKDEADIRGHRKTYIGSMPGRIIDSLIRAQCMNPLILLDEIDKMASSINGDPASAMLEVLDSAQNKSFRDHFLEIPVDLSHCVFICTANTLDAVPRPLIDRMEIISIDSYTRKEKFEIARRHLLPKLRKKYNLMYLEFKISSDALYAVIDSYTHESGVRNLERVLDSLMRKTAKLIASGEAPFVNITVSNLDSYLPFEHKMKNERISHYDEVGVVNGLAYTQVGGDILKIEVSAPEGSGKLELTGSLGDVMKESAKAAITYIRCNAKALNIDPDFYKNRDIHIHVPEGAVPKDGPSAGVTIMTALTSELSGVPVRRDVAMTGEITLRGRVLPIGGLKEKTAAAYAAGVKTVLIPQDNLDDLKTIDPEVREKLEFIPCANANDVLKNAMAYTSGKLCNTVIDFSNDAHPLKKKGDAKTPAVIR